MSGAWVLSGKTLVWIFFQQLKLCILDMSDERSFKVQQSTDMAIVLVSSSVILLLNRYKGMDRVILKGFFYHIK